MAKKTSKKNSKNTNEMTLKAMSGTKEFTRKEIVLFLMGVVLLLFGFYTIYAFTSYLFTGSIDQSMIEHPQAGDVMENNSGNLGADWAHFWLDSCFGLPSYFLAVFVLMAGLKLTQAYKFKLHKWFISCAVLTVWGSIAFTYFLDGLFAHTHLRPGGLHGEMVVGWLMVQVQDIGILLILVFVAICFLIYLSRQTINYIRKVLNPTHSFLTWREKHEAKRKALEEIRREEMAAKAIQEQELTYNEGETLTEEEANQRVDETYNTTTVDFTHSDTTELPTDGETDGEVGELTLTVDVPQTEESNIVFDDTKTVEETEDAETNPMSLTEVDVPEDPEEADPSLQKPYDPKLDLENYKYPTINLLNKIEDDNQPSVDMNELNCNKDRIITILRNFGVEISSIKATVGPTITLYEIVPAQGVKIAKIRGLEDDIALSLSALGIRIIAPIPGKGTVGIEVPNKKPRIVSMESIINSKVFQESTYELPIALGKTITNEVFMVDLAKMPHLLVAGATGQGKSVGLNAIITSLLYKKHPAELKLVMVDPKKVEFSIYAPIEKHFLAKVPDDNSEAIITDVNKVVQTLKSLCEEMDTRYDLLKKAGGVRNIKEYNAKFKARHLNPENGHKFMPYIVVIIDEFGDLIMTAGKEVELPIARIAQLARAVGIHMIIATQRPTTNIITGTIKANFPARMAFKVSAMIDSRTILDRPGANQLVGRGDMLFLAGSEPVRVQCAFVDTPEVEEITKFISKQQGYACAFELPEVEMEGESSGAADVDMNKLDPMFEEAARLIVINQQGSTSLIQRKMSLGYNRAGRIMDQLERAGIVGPSLGSKARDVLCSDEIDLEMKLKALNL
jgi:S-DNA-T family DNA segregation ATPase FtsK/SpoIIIE